jgi:mRNA interferase RelE/StbE
MNPLHFYQIIIEASAWREINDLSEAVQNKLFDKIYTLELDPRPSGCKRLKGKTGFYRVRIGDFRVVYDIQDSILVVVVVEVFDRKHGYD